MKLNLLAGDDSKGTSSESTHFLNECNTFYLLLGVKPQDVYSKLHLCRGHFQLNW